MNIEKRLEELGQQIKEEGLCSPAGDAWGILIDEMFRILQRAVPEGARTELLSFRYPTEGAGKSTVWMDPAGKAVMPYGGG